MGCCETRDIKHKKNIRSSSMPSKSDVKDFHKLGIVNLSSIKDQKIEQIVSEIDLLESKKDWEIVKSEAKLSIKKRIGSTFSSEFLVSRLNFIFERLIPIQILLDEINIDKNRKNWDKNLSLVENIEEKTNQEYLMYSVFSVFGFKTEYLEKKYVFERNNEIFIVVYSVEDDRKPIKSITRAHTYLGVIRISEHQGKTDITVYNQTNPNSMVAKFGSAFVISKLSDWANVLKKHIYKVIEKPDKEKVVI